MKKTLSMVLALLFLALSANAHGERMATLCFNVEETTVPMSPMLYGLFFEDINYAADGGLYAELLQNRSFEYRSFPDQQPYDAFTGWIFNHKMAGRGSVSVGTKAPLNDNNPRYMRVMVDKEPYKAVNTGYPDRIGQAGIFLKAGLTYQGFIYLRSLDYSGQVSVRLETLSGEALSETTLLSPQKQWEKHPYTLTALRGEKAVLAFTLLGTGTLDMDMATLFPGDAYGAHWPNGGLRADLVLALADLRPRFIRFPGGCVAEGSYTPENIYRWKDTIGPIEARRENENTWGGMQSYGLGFHEYFQLCEDLGAQPLPVVSAAMVCQVRDSRDLPLYGEALQDYIQDILDLIAYAKGPVDSPYGRLRAENGHPEPFSLNYLAIGNENWGSEYFYRYGQIAAAVKEHYPDIQLVVAAGPVAEGDLIEGSWATIKQRFPGDLVDEHYYMPTQWFLDNAHRYDSYSREHNPVFLGEYAAHEPVTGGRRPNNLRAALAEAAYLCGLERNADLVLLSCYAPLLAREGRQHWSPNLIWFNQSSVLKTPSYYVQQLFSATLGQEVLSSSLTGEGLHHVVTRGEDVVYVKIVNSRETGVSLSMEGVGVPDGQAAVTSLSGQPHQVNSFVKPDTLSPRKGSLTFTSGNASLTLPPWSVYIIEIPLQTQP